MLKRLWIYSKAMFPIFPRLFLACVLFFEVYLLTILTNGAFAFNITFSDFVGALTIFCFLFFLRAADDLKDAETDRILFPDRVIPSGKVKEQDVRLLAIFLCSLMVGMNVLFMPNLLFFFILFAYGLLMSVWFFKKYEIQRSLPLALITHNPVQIILNIYIISYACVKYNLPLLSWNNFLIAMTLYFPGLVWELSRKVWAPQDETEYVTYSKLFGYKKMTIVILFIMFFDVITSSLLMYQLLPIGVVTVIGSYLWLVWQGKIFIDNPKRFKLVSKIEWYEYITEVTMLLVIAFFIITN